jgi:hypothetical protein
MAKAKKSSSSRKSKTHFEQVSLKQLMKRVTYLEVPKASARDKADDRATDSPGRETGSSRGSGHFHGVRFYSDADSLCRIVGGFIGEGLERGDIAVVIATPEHTARIESCLRSRGIEVDEQKRQGRLMSFDARETLQLFMRDGMPNPGSFRRALSSALMQARRGREHCAIRAYGEMVDLLWKDGFEAAAIRLETLWNQLARTHDFKLLCGYSMGNFYKGVAIEEIQKQHSHLVADDGTASAFTGAGAVH